MSRRVFEGDVKEHLFPKYGINVSPVVSISKETDLEELVKENPWLETSKLVVKPNELFGRRGKLGLVGINLTWLEALEFINDKLLGREITTIDKVKGVITRALVEKFTPHEKEDEFMASVMSIRQGAEVSLSMKGGMNVDADWEKNVKTIVISVQEKVDLERLKLALLGLMVKAGFYKQSIFTAPQREAIIQFLANLYLCFDKEDATLVQVNPWAIDRQGKPIALDARVELDQTAFFLHDWPFEFPPEFGQEPSEEEARIAAIDEDIGGSVKLKVMNRKGLIWLLTAGGGGSIIFTDTVADLGYGKEIGNYAEYSGDPPEEAVFPLAEEIIKLATKYPTPKDKKKYLFVGGGIANFTDVKTTFAGIISALRIYADKLKEHRVEIWVRRGGPNWEEGLQAMRDVGKELDLEIHTYGPDDHMTNIVKRALARHNFGGYKRSKIEAGEGDAR